MDEITILIDVETRFIASNMNDNSRNAIYRVSTARTNI